MPLLYLARKTLLNIQIADRIYNTIPEVLFEVKFIINPDKIHMNIEKMEMISVIVRFLGFSSMLIVRKDNNGAAINHSAHWLVGE